MPNHVASTLTVSGKKDLVSEIQKFLKGRAPSYYQKGDPNDKSGYFKPSAAKVDGGEVEELCMNKVIPVPLEVLQRGYDGHNNPLNAGKLDGYNWQIQNWGTKWGCYDVEVSTGKLPHGRVELFYSFNTAWSPIIEIVKALGLKYPRAKFVYTYEDEGCGFIGEVTVRGDAVVVDEAGDNEGEFEAFYRRKYGDEA